MLTDLYLKFQERGLQIIGFPCNQFGSQEPGTNAEIKEFAAECYGANFPLMSKTDVNGVEANEVFRYLRRMSRLYDDNTNQTRVIPWNFTKFVVNLENGRVTYFNPRTKYEDLEKTIEYILVGGQEPDIRNSTMEDQKVGR